MNVTPTRVYSTCNSIYQLIDKEKERIKNDIRNLEGCIVHRKKNGNPYDQEFEWKQELEDSLKAITKLENIIQNINIDEIIMEVKKENNTDVV